MYFVFKSLIKYFLIMYLVEVTSNPLKKTIHPECPNSKTHLNRSYSEIDSHQVKARTTTKKKFQHISMLQVINTTMITHKHGHSRTTRIYCNDGPEWVKWWWNTRGRWWGFVCNCRTSKVNYWRGGTQTEPMGSLGILYGSTTSPITLEAGSKAKKSVKHQWVWELETQPLDFRIRELLIASERQSLPV